MPAPAEALRQLAPLAALAGDPRRVSVRFDPLLSWREGGEVRSNLAHFEGIAAAAAAAGIMDVRTSFAQWYGKARRRAEARGFPFVEPPEAEKRSVAEALARTAAERGLALHACCQPALAGVPGLRMSACIDGALLGSLHPRREPASRRLDRSQRTGCFCTESRDIGSYAQACPHGCVYCYASAAA